MADYYDSLTAAKESVEADLSARKEELAKLEEDLSDQKINPYGITNIDFSKRLELVEDITKMEGVVMGLQLAQDTFVANAGQTNTVDG
jgi:hypothetical protein